MAFFLLCLYICCVAAQCGYALLFTGIIGAPRFSGQRRRKGGAGPGCPPVSVILCARNEAHHLKQYLPLIAAQRYGKDAGPPAFEVIVVDDASTDDTQDVLAGIRETAPWVQVVSIRPEEPRPFPGKKFALSRGVAAASHGLLLLTDADCAPASEFWLEEMTAPLRRGKVIAAGYGGYRRRPGALNAFIRWETLHTFLQYRTYALAGMPYMAVGRNLACTREALEQAQASSVWNALPSGDDDLLMRTVADGSNTAVVDRADAFTWTDAKATWPEWRGQKQRHLSTGKYYRPRIRALLGAYGASHGLMWLLFFSLLFTVHWGMAMVLLLLRCSLYWPVWYAMARRLGERQLLPWFPLCDIGWAVYNFTFAPWIIWKNKQQWTSS